MDVTTYNFGINTSEKETALLLHNFGLTCVSLNWKMKNSENQSTGEIDGVFYDELNQLYLIYDDSIQKEGRQDKMSKFLNKWKDAGNQAKLIEDLNLKSYPIYVLYIDKSQKDTKLESLDYAIDEFTKIIYTEDYLYFDNIFKIIGKWAKNDFYNYLNIKPRKTIKQQITATQIWVGNTPAYVFADRVENILNYCFISRRKNNSTGYQRLVEKKRVDKMSALIKTNKINAFPNSILLNCVDAIDFTPKSKSECPCAVQFDLPNNFSSCKVVDGQHRLLAFSKLESRIQDSHTLPIVLFQQMPIENEIQTFIEINDSQKGIDPNLIYSLKADLAFQVGTKENREKIAVEIAKRLHQNTPIFQENIFFGNAGEQRKNKITLTAVVQALLEFKIVDSNNSFLQKDEQDVDTPHEKIREIINILLSKDTSNISFYKTNNGIQLILKFCSIIHRNIDKQIITTSLDLAIDGFIASVTKNKNSLQKKYGKAGFNSLSNMIFTELKKSAVSFNALEFEIKKLK